MVQQIKNNIMEKTLGEKRVRTDFNITKDIYVDLLKEKSAELINIIDKAANNPKWDDETLGEWKRLKSLAMTSVEEAAMWAVKAATI